MLDSVISSPTTHLIPYRVLHPVGGISLIVERLTLASRGSSDSILQPKSGPNLVHHIFFPLGVPEVPLCSHAREHGVVDVDGLRIEVEDAARLEAPPSRTDSMKDTG